MVDFFLHLQQRKMVQWALAYLAVAWALLEALNLVGEQFGWPQTILRGLTLVMALGFLLVLVLAWYHGERGRQRVSFVESLMIVALLALGAGMLWQFARDDSAPAAGVPAANASMNLAALLSAPARPIDPNSLAVLPFATSGDDSVQQYFADGLAEDLIIALGRFPDLKVISRNSSFRLRDTSAGSPAIARALGVAHLLEGSVSRAGDQVRVRVELVDGSDGTTLWSQRYDRAWNDLFAMQDAITEAVAGALKVQLLSNGALVAERDPKRPPSGNVDAYSHYLHGAYFASRATRGDMKLAIEHFQKALDIDPAYAMVWSSLSEVWTTIAASSLGGAEARRVYAKARDAVETALTLDRNLASAHAARAELLLASELDWTGAEAEFQTALALAPNDADTRVGLGRVRAALGYPEDAIDLTENALAKDPLRASWYAQLANYQIGLGRLDEAEKSLDKAFQLRPNGNINITMLVVIEIMRGNADTALEHADKQRKGLWAEVGRAMALQIGDNKSAADRALDTLLTSRADSAAFQIAEVYGLRQQPDETFAWLDRAWENRDPGIQYLLRTPFLKDLHGDPRFAAYCRKVGLPLPRVQVAETSGTA